MNLKNLNNLKQFFEWAENKYPNVWDSITKKEGVKETFRIIENTVDYSEITSFTFDYHIINRWFIIYGSYQTYQPFFSRDGVEHWLLNEHFTGGGEEWDNFIKIKHFLEEKQKEAKQKLQSQLNKPTSTNVSELVKQHTSISGLIHEVTKFTTWWSKNNIATVVAYYDGDYRVFLIVVDRKPNAYGRVQSNEIFVFPKEHNCSYWGEHSRKQHNYLSDAKSEASWLRIELSSGYGKYHDHPILLIHPYSDCSRSFDTFVWEPYVRTDYNVSTSDFKPLDIAWVKKKHPIFKKTYYHVGVYLGNGEICNISDPDAVFSEMNIKARITGWSTFLTDRDGELQRHHPIVSFKHYKKIIEQAVKAYWRDYGVDRYDLYNDNCEHFANAIVYGIYYSRQVWSLEGTADGAWCFFTKMTRDTLQRTYNTLWKTVHPSHWENILGNRKYFKVNNGKTDVNLRNEINSWDSNGRFDNLTSSIPTITRDNYEKEYEAKIEQPVNINNCVIM